MNTYPDQVGDPCLLHCLNREGTCPWCGTEGLCCKQNEAINECDGTHVRPHISFKETYPLWDDLRIIPGSGGATESAHRCILPPGKLSAYPEMLIFVLMTGINQNISTDSILIKITLF